jgi:O-antigen ligase
MPIVVIAFGLAAIAWGVIVARRASVLLGVGLLIITAYAFGHEFWDGRIGPLPLTLDRVLLIGLLGAFVVQWWNGGFNLRAMTGGDWLLATLLAVFVVSALFSGHADVMPGLTSKWGRLVSSFAIPAILYALVRQLPVTSRDWTRLMVFVAALGIYLAGTAMCEVAGCWAFVFPRYIADANLGIHFGRGRGPELNSVSLGLYLTASAACAWLLLPQARQRWQQLVLLAAVPLMAFGVMISYTRSTWIGFAAAALVIAAFQIPRSWRIPTVACGVLVGALVACLAWGQLMGIQRGGTAADAEHSVDQRASFAYVSWQMFCDHPVFGVGFGRFFDQKLPYLSDRRQGFELESIRGLHHHNTLLSVLTETGVIGFAAFIAVIAAWARCAWKLATAAALPWVRTHGVLMLALIASYLCSAVFHDLTFLPSQELLLFIMAGLTVNLCQVTIGTGLSVPSTRLLYSSACPVRTC